MGSPGYPPHRSIRCTNDPITLPACSPASPSGSSSALKVRNRTAAAGARVSTDAKWILGAFATGFLVLGGLILTVFSRLDTRIDALAADVARITADVARLLDLH